MPLVRVPSIVVAAPASGSGKTTIAVGLMAALRDRGLRVQGAKVGPDYIDPTYHARVTGRPSRNLDTWLAEPAHVATSFAEAAHDADIAVIEGVMGLYDGRHGDLEAGSTAHVARLLDAAVLLVLDCSRSSATAAAVALGLARFDPRLRIAGVVLNRVASERHAATIRDACARTGVEVLGTIHRDEALALPSRHLGLCPAPEGEDWLRFRTAAAHALTSGIDLDRLLVHAGEGAAIPRRARRRSADLPPVRVAIARDEAFSFYYEESLEALVEAGAELVPFSPLHGGGLPAVWGAYLGGGYPELHAAELARNGAMRASLRQAIARGMPVYAECGALMYLCKELHGADGIAYEMVGAADAACEMGTRRAAMGYVEAEALRSTPFAQAGMVIRGHEFHWSKLQANGAPPAYRILGEDRADGFASPTLHASYVHVNLGAYPRLAHRFVECARTFATEVS